MPSLNKPTMCLTFAFLTFLLLSFTGSPTVWAQQIQVSAADPASAPQGTINLNVRVNGKGFKNGARAKFQVTGTTDPGGVQVNSTTFVSSTEVIANINVADTAVIANFDIQVQNADGRTGKGTELFAVTAKGKPAAICPADITNLQVKFADGPSDLYRSDNGQPYVTTKLKGENIEIMLQQSNCSYDLTMNLYLSKRTTKLTLGAVTIDSEAFNFDRVGSVPITQDTLNADGSITPFTSTAFCTLGVVNDPATGKPVTYPDGTAQDNYGGCGRDAEGNYYVLRSVGIRAEDDAHAFRYQYSPIDAVATWAEGTSFIRVYRPSATQWTLTPDPDTGSWGRHYDKSADTRLGDFSVPFRITVTRVN